MFVLLGSSMFVLVTETRVRAGMMGTDCDWSLMTDTEVLERRRAALTAYAKKAKADPSGARKRLIATGICTRGGKLRPEYGGAPAKAKG